MAPNSQANQAGYLLDASCAVQEENRVTEGPARQGQPHKKIHLSPTL